MGVLSFFTRKKAEQPTAQSLHVECPHPILSARWDSVQDIGNEDKATSFRCAECGADFSVEAAREIRRHHLLVT